jgi:hypothetical protein
MLTKNGPPMPTGRQGAGAIGDQPGPRKPAIDPGRAPGQSIRLRFGTEIAKLVKKKRSH